MAKTDMLVRAQADFRNYDANMAKAIRQLDQFKRDNLSLGGVMKQTTSVMTSMAASYMGVYAAIRGMQKVVGDMVRINKEFEQGTANLASIIGKTTDEISALTTQAKQLGATTKYTAMQITELQTNLARLGFTQQEILNSTTAVQALATATGADLGEAANLAGAALRGFGLNATEMERVASVLSVSTTKSALSFEKLATAVPIVAPVAKQFGFTIEDTVTLLAKLSDAGMDASSAATATRNIFLKMANDSGKLAQALGRPVHSVEEFGEALAEMRKRGMSLNDILSMVGVRSTAAFAVFADNAETLKDFKDSITDCSDAMHDMESKQLNTLQGSLTILNSAWEGLMLSFSESTGPIKTAVDGITELLQAWTKWRNRNKGGDAAISTYELGVSDEQRKTAEQVVTGYRKGGATDEQISQIFTKDKAKLEENRDAARELYDRYDKIVKMPFQRQTKEFDKWKEDFREMFGRETLGKWKDSLDYITQQIAGINDDIALKDYMISMVTPAASAGTSPSGGGTGEENSKSYLARRKAEIEAEIQLNISKLDRMAMDEEEYESEVYEIKKAGLQQIADLYEAETAEKARAIAAIARLDIQYRDTTMRLANRKGNDAESNVYMPGPERSPLERMQQSLRMQQADQASAIDEASFKSLLGVAIQNGIDDLDLDFSHILDDMQEGFDISPETWKDLEAKINERLSSINLNPIELDVKTGNVKELNNQIGSLETNLNGAINVFGQLGDAMQQIDDPGAKVAGIIMGAIANIAGTFAKSLAGTFTPWDWIAAAISGTATMISTIAAIKSATSGGFANGGIVPGNSFSGDNLRTSDYGINSGELILNRAQQGSIASQLQGAAQQTVFVEGRISGKDILLSANNTNRAAGGSRGYYTQVK